MVLFSLMVSYHRGIGAHIVVKEIKRGKGSNWQQLRVIHAFSRDRLALIQEELHRVGAWPSSNVVREEMWGCYSYGKIQ